MATSFTAPKVAFVGPARDRTDNLNIFRRASVSLSLILAPAPDCYIYYQLSSRINDNVDFTTHLFCTKLHGCASSSDVIPPRMHIISCDYIMAPETDLQPKPAWLSQCLRTLRTVAR